jgi:hypothetical protein
MSTITLTIEPSFQPEIGERQPAAWFAAVSVLADGCWHPTEEVVSAMLAASDLQDKSCNGLLSKARMEGDIVQDITRSRTKPVRLTTYGLARWVAGERPADSSSE